MKNICILGVFVADLAFFGDEMIIISSLWCVVCVEGWGGGRNRDQLAVVKS